jgi:hypothetical protein
VRLVVILLVALPLACGSAYEPPPPSADETDEVIVATFEDMARLAREQPTCERWGEEHRRRWGIRRLKAMIDHITRFDKPRGDAFRARYGERIAAASEVVEAVHARCRAELGF